MRIASFNLHFVRPHGPEHDRWLVRRAAVIAAIRDLDAAIVALQEVETFTGKRFSEANIQLDWLREHLPDYRIAAVGDVRSYPSTQPVLYRPGKLAFIDQGFHFYSDTPDLIYSRTYHGSYPTSRPGCGSGSWVVNAYPSYSTRISTIRTASAA